MGSLANSTVRGLSTRKTAGVTTSDSSTEMAKPPITAIANGLSICAPAPTPKAMKDYLTAGGAYPSPKRVPLETVETVLRLLPGVTCVTFTRS